jgi:hypothetical protein
MSEDGDVSVTIEEVAETVTAGDELAVTVAVEAAVDDEETATVELLDFDGDVVASEDVGADDEEAELTWTPDGDAVGSGEIAVQSDTDSATAEVTVEDAPAEFVVEIDSTPEHVPEGGTVAIEATVENTGTLAGSGTVEIERGDETAASMEIELGPGETETIDYSTETGEEDSPEVTLEIVTPDDSASETVPVVTVSVSTVNPVESKGGMSLFGWLMFIGMMILLIPLIPIVVVLRALEILRGLAKSAR